MAQVSTGMINNDIVEASCVIDDNYSIIMGDERFYGMIGKDLPNSLLTLIYLDDRETFCSFISDMQINKPIVIKIKVKKGTYRWVLVRKLNIELKKEHTEINLMFHDVVAQSNTFKIYYDSVRKYRAFMNYVRDKFFEYEFGADLITIYMYVNGRCEIFEKDTLDEWEKRVLRLGFVETADIDMFRRLCSNIRDGVDVFSINIHTSLMSKGFRMDTLNFRGETIVDVTGKVMVAGLITEMNGRYDLKSIMIGNDANKDSATGLLNKRAVTDDIHDIIQNANSNKDSKKMFLMIIDIDNFKSVNDTYGHRFGDEVIADFASELRRTVGERGIAGRIGGDEFMCLLTDYNSIEEVRVFLTAIRSKLRIELAKKNPEYTFTVSIGISAYPDNGTDYDTLFKLADGCLYIAKEKGKDRFIIYTPEIHGDLINRDTKLRNLHIGANFMKPMDKLEMIANFNDKLLQKGRAVLDEVLESIMNQMDIHGILLFNKDKNCEKILGHYKVQNINGEIFKNDKYMELFDEHGVNVIFNISSISADFPKIYELFLQSDVCSTLQIKLIKDGVLKGIICFDTFGEHKRKWSETDICIMYMFVRIISNVY